MPKNISDIYKIKPGLTIALPSLNDASARNIILINEVFFGEGGGVIVILSLYFSIKIVRPGACLIDTNCIFFSVSGSHDVDYRMQSP